MAKVALQHQLAVRGLPFRWNEEGSDVVATDGVDGLATVAGWSEALGELHERISRRFARSEARDRVKRYLVGLLGRIEDKNGWQLTEAIGERDPQGVQRFLNSAKWDADAVRDDLGEYVLEHLADEETGILVVDETGFLKKGERASAWRASTPAPPGTRSTARSGHSWHTPRRRAQPCARQVKSASMVGTETSR